MRLGRRTVTALLGIVLIFQGALVCEARSVFVIHAQNTVENLNDVNLAGIIKGEVRYWENGDPTRLAFSSDAETIKCLESESQIPFGRLKNIWTRLAFTGRGFKAKRFQNDSDLFLFMKKNPGALACIPESKVQDWMTIVPISR
ncbi:MAG: hypothetical protein ACPGN3_17115 [Opitutales bacterium]